MLGKYATPRDLSIHANRGRIFDIEYLFYTTGERSSDWVERERTDETPPFKNLRCLGDFWLAQKG